MLSPSDALARVPQWRNKKISTTELSGGITNKNYRVDVDGESFVLRLGGANTEHLGIDRKVERDATAAAASLGIAPEVIYFIEPEGYLVTRFVKGRPLPPPEITQPQNLKRVVDALKQIHSLPAIPKTFSPFRVVEDYEQTAKAHGVNTFPSNFDYLLSKMRQVEAAFNKEPFAPKLCHNDLLNENFLDDGHLRIIDWEYAGMGDVFFDLANFAVNHQLNDEQDRLLLTLYFSEATPKHLARHKLMKIMSDFREAMWGMVQQGISTLDFDFRGYADKHFARMTGSFEEERYGEWMEVISEQ
jgi:thiamine kinase-like enzyme